MKSLNISTKSERDSSLSPLMPSPLSEPLPPAPLGGGISPIELLLELGGEARKTGVSRNLLRGWAPADATCLRRREDKTYDERPETSEVRDGTCTVLGKTGPRYVDLATGAGTAGRAQATLIKNLHVTLYRISPEKVVWKRIKIRISA